MQRENVGADIQIIPLGAVPALRPGTGEALRLVRQLTGASAAGDGADAVARETDHGTSHYSTVGYGTEGGLFQLAGIDTVVCGPGSMAQGHTANEYIELSQVPTANVTLEAQRSQARRAVVAASIGNGLEWFDVIVYGAFAVTIARLFFPTNDPTVSLLLAFGSFGISFIMRPLGGILIGRYAERAGRKAGMLVSISLMFIGTFFIAFFPTAQMIGVAAVVILLLARLIQGFAAGGEFGTATAFLIEHAPNRRAFYASWQVATQGGAILLAGIFGFVLNNYLSQQALDSWGWRVPFSFALLIGPVGWYIRSKMEDTPEFLAMIPSASPLRETLIDNGGRLVSIVGVVALGSVGMLADRVGPAKLMTWAAIGTVLLAIPMFILLHQSPLLVTIVVIELVLGILATLYFAPLPAIMSAMFPVQIRTTGLSLGYNVGVTVFGGFAPFIMTFLIEATGSLLVPGFYLAAIAALSLASLVVARRVFHQR